MELNLLLFPEIMSQLLSWRYRIFSFSYCLVRALVSLVVPLLDWSHFVIAMKILWSQPVPWTCPNGPSITLSAINVSRFSFNLSINLIGIGCSFYVTKHTPVGILNDTGGTLALGLPIPWNKFVYFSINYRVHLIEALCSFLLPHGPLS